MAKLGSPRTTKFSIGTAEIRFGPVSLANRLTQAHSGGLVDNVTLEVNQESVDLLGGFPQVAVDTQIISQDSSITATMREYSARNLGVMLGEGVSDYTSYIRTLMVTDLVEGGDQFDVTANDGAQFTTGDLICIYPENSVADFTVTKIAGVTGDTITLDSQCTSLFDYDGTTETVNVFQTRASAIGGITATNYMSAQMVQLDRQFGQPVIANLWKTSISQGMTMDTSATDFASTELGLKTLEPAASEYAAGGDLVHLASVIPSFPSGMLILGGDVAPTP